MLNTISLLSPSPPESPERFDSPPPPISTRLPWGAYGLRSLALGYVALMILIPLGGIVAQAFSGGGRSFWAAITDPEAWDAVRLTLVCAVGIALINAAVGTMVAWTLVRFQFPGKMFLSLLIDLPFAVPTVVTGLMIVMLYGPQTTLGIFFAEYGIRILFAQPGIWIALLFVTLPFVIRTVQPVLMELDPEVEQAAWTLGAGGWLTFRRVTLPVLFPAILTGSILSFTRALGEFGSVVLVAGNIPFRSQTAPVYIYGQIESDRPQAATAVSVLLLAISLTTILLLNRTQNREARQRHAG
ncbi:MAG: sulfate ABC transporter permease subunit CysT [Armatimonadetes bacterium]|nr:sulfate ABC transporter permease subunit CysT [Armatimonadota bacterium]